MKYVLKNYFVRNAGLPHTQGNSGNFQLIENLRETQGIFILFFKLRETQGSFDFYKIFREILRFLTKSQ